MQKILKLKSFLIDYLIKEWLMLLSGVGFGITIILTLRLPHYSTREFQVLFILFILFIVVHGLQRSGLISHIAGIIEQGRMIPLKLIVTTFFLSMLVTNDIALLVMVPLTLSLNLTRKDILVIMEAIAANAGSTLTPIGNPQNLFIYWFYGISPLQFISTVMPFSLLFLVLLIIASFWIKTAPATETNTAILPVKINKYAYIYLSLLVIVLLAVLHIIPVSVTAITIIFAIIFDRKVLKIDYALLGSFFFLFGLTANLKSLFQSSLSDCGHIFLASAFTSQLISNVPATLIFAKFTTNWPALLWGVNAGGFGSLIGSLANLIAYRIYLRQSNSPTIGRFTVLFLGIGYIAFILSIAWYYLWLAICNY